MKPTGTFIVIALFAIVAIAGLVWTYFGGTTDGSLVVAKWFGGIAILGAVLSKLLGGAWFTDSSGGH